MPDVVVVGAGPAGLAAARRAVECGASVTMVDDNPAAGGQIWRAAGGRLRRETERWLARAELITGARVFAAPAPGRLALETLQGEMEIAYRSLVLATGARERFLPFPGWTLPNVMGAGGLQALAKSGLPVERKKVVVAGCGPLLLAVAEYLRDHGANVRLVAEQASRSSLLRFGLGLAGRPGKLIQAAGFRAGLLGVRYFTSCWPMAAEGSEKLERVIMRRGNRTWSESCDYLACGFGLIPNVELPALLGCRLGAKGVAVDEFQQTSVAGVYCAGEVTGIGGLELSLVEGEIAGYAAAGGLEAARKLFGARESRRRFADGLERAFAPREELKTLAADDTLVCRCEDVTWARVRRFTGWREAKLHTRCGMGPCQGRVCGGAVEFLLGWKPGSVRPPVFPVRVGSLAGAVPSPQCGEKPGDIR